LGVGSSFQGEVTRRMVWTFTWIANWQPTPH
jgi:hypothetical protein